MQIQKQPTQTNLAKLVEILEICLVKNISHNLKCAYHPNPADGRNLFEERIRNKNNIKRTLAYILKKTDGLKVRNSTNWELVSDKFSRYNI